MDAGALEFLKGYVDEGVNGYYTKMWELNALAQTASFEKVNVFGAICSYTMPKACRGSHPYTVTFSVVDPSISLSTSVPFVWFCSKLDSLHMNFKVGDLIRIENATLQYFNNYPQLVGKDSAASVTIFHRNEDFLTAWPTTPLSIVPPLDTESANGDEDDRRARNRAKTGKRQPYLDPAWSVTHLGVVDVDKTSKKDRTAMAQVSSERPPMMWPQEIHHLLYLHDWVDRYFSTHSFADSSQVATQHVTLHALQLFLHASTNTHAYAALTPAAEPPSLSSPSHHPMQNNKCDLVCLVMNVMPPSANVDGLARMTVWDGTTNGMYTPSMTVGKAIQVALDAPAIYDTAAEAQRQSGASAVVQVQAQEHSAPSTSSGTSSSSSSSSSTTALSSVPTPAVSELETQLKDLAGKAYSVRKYAGSAVKVMAADASVNQHILRCKAGMWVRIRNLYALPAPPAGSEQGGGGGALGIEQAARACVKADSHVCSLSPKYLDVRHLVRVYLNRMTHLLMRNVQASLPPTAIVAAASGGVAAVASGVAGGSARDVKGGGPVAPAVPAGPVQVFSGEPPTFIGVVKSGPAPAKYCLRACLESWWPSNIEDFVTTETNEEGTEAPVLQFALTVADSTGSTLLLLRGTEAEHYLSATASDLQAHPAAREAVRGQLEALRDQKILAEFKVKVFVDKHIVPLPGQPETNKRARGSRREADDQLTYVKKTKRMIAFDTKAGITSVPAHIA